MKKIFEILLIPVITAINNTIWFIGVLFNRNDILSPAKNTDLVGDDLPDIRIYCNPAEIEAVLRGEIGISLFTKVKTDENFEEIITETELIKFLGNNKENMIPKARVFACPNAINNVRAGHIEYGALVSESRAIFTDTNNASVIFPSDVGIYTATEVSNMLKTFNLT